MTEECVLVAENESELISKAQEKPDIRWKQRFSNYKKVLKRLNENSEFLTESRNSNNDLTVKVAIEALIKCFELSFELAWQTMKDYISYKGYVREVHGSRDSIKGAIQFNIIENGDLWMNMIEDRNMASHVYDEENAGSISKAIIDNYIEELNKFGKKMDSLK